LKQILTAHLAGDAGLSNEQFRPLNIDDLCVVLLDKAKRMRRGYESEFKERWPRKG